MKTHFTVINVKMATDLSVMHHINIPYILISVVSPEYPNYELAYNDMCKDVLKLRFHDVDEKGNINSLVETGKIITRIDDKIAQQIIDFSQKHNDIKNMVIHCEAGVSRSPGIAMALSEIRNGTEIHPDEYVDTLYDIRHHNVIVKKKILDVYYEKK